MNRWRILGLVAVTLLAAWAALRSCSPDEQQEAGPAPPPPREIFDASKPIRVSVVAQSDGAGKSADLSWLGHELPHLLSRGGMHVAPVSPKQTTDTFTLRVELAADGRQALLMLVAPDEVVERRESVALNDETRLGQVSAIVARLPQFLAVRASYDWTSLIGTDDARAYDIYASGAKQLLGAAGHGFTRPPAGVRGRTVERLETLTRSQRQFARAWAILALAYLSLGGEDAASLAQLAESSAQRALSLDDELPDAHAALGLANLRHNKWIAAREQFDRALTLDVNTTPALEGMACLLADAGRYEEAQPIASRAVFLQPRNIGARECLAYTLSAVDGAENDDAVPDPGPDPPHDPASPPAARARALASILDGRIDLARRQLRSSVSRYDFQQWAAPLIRAAGNRRHVPDALRAITRAANEGRIDTSTEILCGAALRQSEFVFNRMSRLQLRSEHVPLRILWMPQTAFLRKHDHFEQVIGTAGLAAFWQEHGIPDVCAKEPAVYGCKLR